jgi:DNA-binding transcriptional LysR family regulator
MLETELGYKLFLRSSEGLKLSPQGRVLLPEAQRALEQLEKIKGNKGIIKFKIGCHPSVGMFILGNFLKLMHKEQPNLDFEIINAPSSDINKLAVRGEIDFGLVSFLDKEKVTGVIQDFKKGNKRHSKCNKPANLEKNK